MTFALFSISIAWMLLAIYFGLRAAESRSIKRELRYCTLSSLCLRAAGVFSLITLISAFYDAFRSL